MSIWRKLARTVKSFILVVAGIAVMGEIYPVMGGDIKIVHQPLITFSDSAMRNNWFLNSWGGAKKGSMEFIEGRDEKITTVMRINIDDVSSLTLSNPKVFSGLQKEWVDNPIDGFNLWLKSSLQTGTLQLVYKLKDHTGQWYDLSNNLGLKGNGWQLLEVPTGGFNRERRTFKREELENIQLIMRNCSGALEIGEIGVYRRVRALHDAGSEPLLGYVAKSSTTINIDGVIDNDEWREAYSFALSAAEGNNQLCQGLSPQEKTRILITWQDDGIYCAARCFKNDMKTLKADITQNSHDVYKDESIEFYFDPSRTTRKMIKYAINANGKVGVHGSQNQSHEYKVAAKKFADRWEMEFFIPWDALNVKLNLPFLTGFNVTRTTIENNKISERTGWTTGKWDGIADFGVLILAPGNELNADNLQNLSLAKASGAGSFMLCGDNMGGERFQYRFNTFAGSGNGLIEQKNSGVISPGAMALKLNVPDDKGCVYNLNFIAFNERKFPVAFFEAIFAVDVPSDWQEKPIDAVALFPTPKVFERIEGRFFFDKGTTYNLTGEGLEFCGKTLETELRNFYGIEVAKSPATDNAAIIIDCGIEAPQVKALLKEFALDSHIREIKFDGFILYIAPDKILITSKDKRGTYYGVSALLDLIKMCSGVAAPVQVSCMKVVDWPDYEIRYWHNFLGPFAPMGKDIEFYKQMLAKLPLRLRYNGFFFEKGRYYNWRSGPKVAVGNAWTRDDYAEIIDFINRHYSPVMPCIQSHGHMWWLLSSGCGFEHLREDGDVQTLCTGNPATYQTLFEFYDEDIKMCSRNPEYKPDYFLSCLDEVRWQTHATPEAKRCIYCAGKAKNEIYLEHIKKLNAYLRDKGLNMIMFADMIAKAHNGLNQFQCAKIRERIPREVILGHWSRLSYPCIGELADMGFENWKMSTGYKVDRLYESSVKAHAFLVFAYHWWLTYNRNPSQAAYGPMAQALYANACWNMFPDDDDSTYRKHCKIYGNWLMHNWSRKPMPRASSDFFPVDISAIADNTVTDAKADDGTGWFDYGPDLDLSLVDFNVEKFYGVPVAFSRKNGEIMCASFPKLEKKQVELAVNSRIGSIIVLHAADLTREDGGNDRFRSRNIYGDPQKGKEVARFTVIYADNSRVDFHAQLGWNVAPWHSKTTSVGDVFSKYVMDSRALIEGKTQAARKRNLPDDIAIYQYEWVNPKPDVAVRKMEIASLGTHVSYAVLAITARGVSDVK